MIDWEMKGLEKLMAWLLLWPQQSKKKTLPRIKDNEGDILREQGDIKELMRADFPYGKKTIFDDLLALVSKSIFNKEGQVFLKYFESLIRAKGGDEHRFCAWN